MAVLLLWIAALLSAASAGNMHTPLKMGQTFMAGSTNCTQGSTGWALISHGIAEKLFTVDKEGRVVPQVAQSVRRLDKLSWEVTVKAGYKFSDGTPVTATHVAEALTRLNTVNSGAKASLGKMTMTSLDDLRLKIESEQATPVMDAVLAEWAFAIFLEKDGKLFYTGPFAVETFVANDRFELVPNVHYPRASERPLLVIKKFPNGSSLASALEARELDMAFHIPVESLPKLRQMDNMTVKSFPVGYQYMVWYNMRKPHLSDVKVRQALDIALDRQALQQELRAGKATRSFFPENTPYYLKDTDLHADKSGAERLLDEAGWLKNASGIRVKAGVPLTLDIVAYPQRPSLPTVQPVIKQTLAALGITVTTRVTSGQTRDELDRIISDKSFDLLLWAQHTLPAGDPKSFMSMFFRSGAGNNHAGLNSSEIDILIDALSHAETPADRVSATAAAHRAILEKVPVSILLTPSWHVGLGSRRLAGFEPWGSDFYVIHADFGLSSMTQTSTAAPITWTDVNRAMYSGLSVVTLLLLCATL